MDFLHADRARIASVDDTLVIFDGHKLPFIVKNGPVFLDEAINLVSYACVEVRQIKLLAQIMSCLVIYCKKNWVDLIKR